LVCWKVAAALSAVGLGLATYLTVMYISHGVPACGGLGDCERVTTSQYARFLGVPVAALGVAMYSALLMGNLGMLAANKPGRTVGLLVVLLSGAGVAFSSYLTAVSLAVLKATCIYCLSSFAIVTAIFLVSLVALVLERSRASFRPDEIWARDF
jgi:uncharacterized membrane protein